jgi:hypothetical protein
LPVRGPPHASGALGTVTAPASGEAKGMSSTTGAATGAGAAACCAATAAAVPMTAVQAAASATPRVQRVLALAKFMRSS